MNKILYSAALLSLLPTSGWAHSGHAHAPADSLQGILHTLMTHPGLFGLVGLLLIAALFYRQS